MAAAFTLARPEYEQRHERMRELGARAGELRARALELAELELSAYAPVLEAAGLPKDDPARRERLSEALSEAADSPLEIARIAAELAALGTEVASTGNRTLAGDAETGALLAEASCRAAARLAEINLAARPADARLAEIRRLRSDLDERRVQP